MNIQEIRLTLTDLSVDEVNAILAGLQEIPAKICNPLSTKIKMQAESAIAKIEAAEAEANKTAE